MHTQILLSRAQAGPKSELERLNAEVVAFFSSPKESERRKCCGGERLVEAIKEHQKAWGLAVQAECEIAGALTGAGSPWQTVEAQKCEAAQVAQRIAATKEALDCLSMAPQEDPSWEQEKCMRPIIPNAPPRFED